MTGKSWKIPEANEGLVRWSNHPTMAGDMSMLHVGWHRLSIQWEIFRILKWRYVSTIFLAIFCGDIHLHRPYIGLIYARYLHFRILEWPLIYGDLQSDPSVAMVTSSRRRVPEHRPALGIWWRTKTGSATQSFHDVNRQRKKGSARIQQQNSTIYVWLMVSTPPKKYESQWEGLSHILWKIKHVPNHQPDLLSYVTLMTLMTNHHVDRAAHDVKIGDVWTRPMLGFLEYRLKPTKNHQFIAASWTRHLKQYHPPMFGETTSRKKNILRHENPLRNAQPW